MIDIVAIFLVIAGSVCGYMIQIHNEQSVYTPEQVILSGSLSFFALIITMKLIPVVSPKCVKANLFGKDINKKGDSKIPESLGIVSGIICLIAIICLQWTFQSMRAEYNAALISMCLMLLLGFCDDVLDLRWRDKILLSFVASIPLLIGYTGETTIIIPKPLREYFGVTTNLGYLYHVYMANTVVFCTNSINIYAGINGLETGQSLVMAAFVLYHNCTQLGTPEEPYHLLSIFLMLPFLASTLGLFNFNRYPSRVFVGDSFTYFSGMSFAVCSILGHFSKTMMVIFIPQLINFILSLPQLFHIVPCPRHRLPKLDPKTGKLNATPNYTLINLWLYLFGPKTEKRLCVELLMFQVFCCSAGLLLRHEASVFYY